MGIKKLMIIIPKNKALKKKRNRIGFFFYRFFSHNSFWCINLTIYRSLCVNWKWCHYSLIQNWSIITKKQVINTAILFFCNRRKQHKSVDWPVLKEGPFWLVVMSSLWPHCLFTGQIVLYMRTAVETHLWLLSVKLERRQFTCRFSFLNQKRFWVRHFQSFVAVDTLCLLECLWISKYNHMSPIGMVSPRVFLFPPVTLPLGLSQPHPTSL